MTDTDALDMDQFHVEIEKVIGRYFADTENISTGWVLLTCTVQPEDAHLGSAQYGTHVPDNQPSHVTHGLLTMALTRARRYHEHQIDQWINEDNRDDGEDDQ